MIPRLTREDMKLHLDMSYDDDELDEDTRAAILDEFEPEEPEPEDE